MRSEGTEPVFDPDRLSGLLTDQRRARVYEFARHNIGDADIAQDVTQEALLRLQRAFPDFRGEAEVDTWLFRVVINLCRDHYRSEARRREVPLGPSAPDDHTTQNNHALDDLWTGEVREIIQIALDQVDPDQRESILLRYMVGLSYAEIGAATDTPAGTVASRIFRGLRKLGELLEPHRDALT